MSGFWMLYVPLGAWAVCGIALGVALRRSTPLLVLRLAATFLALWALLATTALIWVLYNGGWPAAWALAANPFLLFEEPSAGLWFAGAGGALAVLGVAFAVNQLVGRSLMKIWEPRSRFLLANRLWAAC